MCGWMQEPESNFNTKATVLFSIGAICGNFIYSEKIKKNTKSTNNIVVIRIVCKGEAGDFERPPKIIDHATVINSGPSRLFFFGNIADVGLPQYHNTMSNISSFAILFIFRSYRFVVRKPRKTRGYWFCPLINRKYIE